MNTTEVMVRFLALLTIAADVVVIGAVVVLWLTRGAKTAPEWASSARAALSGYALPLAWLVALTSTLGSLYYSEIAHFVPCKLCWYQRIAMYPLAVTLGIAALRRDWNVRRYVLPMIAIGAAISIYHYMIERFPDLAGSASCDPSAPCTILWVWQFHFISIPFQALSGFALIAALMFMTPRGGESDSRADGPENVGRAAQEILV